MSWHIRHFCKCGEPNGHQVAFADAWFFHVDLCPACGTRLKYSTEAKTVRRAGPFWNRRWDVLKGETE